MPLLGEETFLWQPDTFIRTKQGNWLNEIEGQSEINGHYVTKDAAVAAGRSEAQARETEHVIHNQDGTISAPN